MKIIVFTLTVGATSLMIGCATHATDSVAGNVSEVTYYPLVSCVVSGETLGSMGDPYIFDYKGTEVRLCCKSCLDDFNKDPEKYVKMLSGSGHVHGTHNQSTKKPITSSQGSQSCCH